MLLRDKIHGLTGFTVRDAWLDEACARMRLPSGSVDVAARAVLDALLFTDLSLVMERGCLVDMPHDGHMRGDQQWVLQVDAVLDIGVPREKAIEDEVEPEERVPAKRLLKLLLSDGLHTVVAVELEPIEGLSVTTRLGSKVCLRQVMIRRGHMLLGPNTCRVLGGHVSAKMQQAEVLQAEQIEKRKERG
jgi:hypothetical protein